MIETKLNPDQSDTLKKFVSSTSQISHRKQGWYNCDFVGFGATEYESKYNLIEQIDNLIKNLKRIKTQS